MEYPRNKQFRNFKLHAVLVWVVWWNLASPLHPTPAMNHPLVPYIRTVYDILHALPACQSLSSQLGCQKTDLVSQGLCSSNPNSSLMQHHNAYAIHRMSSHQVGISSSHIIARRKVSTVHSDILRDIEILLNDPFGERRRKTILQLWYCFSFIKCPTWKPCPHPVVSVPLLGTKAEHYLCLKITLLGAAHL